jgi:Cu+-exporting ATPase
MALTKTFPIIGMHCAGCSTAITQKILKVPGVVDAKVAYTTEKATITYDETKINWQDLEKAVSQVGTYKIILPNTNPEHMDHEPSGNMHHNHAQSLKDAELKKLKNKLIISAILTTILMLGSLTGQVSHQLAFILTSVIMFYSGAEFFQNTYLGLKSFSANMDTLIAVGTGAAYLYSSVVTFWPDFFPDQAVYYETAGAIISLILLGRYLEARAKGRASEAIQKLLHLQVKKARLLRDNQEVEVELEQVKVGDKLIIKPGEKIPVDGRIIEGESYLDESLITGESKPTKKRPGDKVIGSTINSQGRLVVEATGVGAGTILAKIIQMVQQAQDSQAPIQKLVDKVSGVFVPVVIVFAIIAFAVWYYLIGVSFTAALVIFITILIISCPCALGLATPISIMVGTGRGAQKGILIKNAEKLQIAGHIDAIALDKTGTLTLGNFAVTDIVLADIKPKWGEGEILEIAASIEHGSQHPIATAILKKAQTTQLSKVDNFKAIDGKGITGSIKGKFVAIGTKAFMEEDKHISCAVLNEQVAKLKSMGKTIAYVSVDKKTVGAIALADEPKPNAQKLVEQLESAHIDTWMITGDNQETAQVVAKRLGVKNLMAEVLPSQKVDKIKELQKRYQVVAMVGDGVNDAPSLAQANVGIAMSTGTDVAIETADITLLRGNLDLVFQAISLSRKTMNNIKQNLFWAFGYNVLLIPVAAGILIPFSIQIHPTLASGAMAFSSISVVLNALRLKNA